MKDIHIRFIPQAKQRYKTVGDYWETNTSVEFRINEMSSFVRSMAILIHELWEWARAKIAGIPIEKIDAFDMSYDYINGPHKDDVGLDPACPVHTQHMEADVLERACIVMAGDDWVEYSKEVDGLFPEKCSKRLHAIAEKVAQYIAKEFNGDWEEYVKAQDAKMSEEVQKWNVRQLHPEV